MKENVYIYVAVCVTLRERERIRTRMRKRVYTHRLWARRRKLGGVRPTGRRKRPREPAEGEGRKAAHAGGTLVSKATSDGEAQVSGRRLGSHAHLEQVRGLGEAGPRSRLFAQTPEPSGRFKAGLLRTCVTLAPYLYLEVIAVPAWQVRRVD